MTGLYAGGDGVEARERKKLGLMNPGGPSDYLIIGRTPKGTSAAPELAIDLSDDLVSNHHAAIHWDQMIGAWCLEDLGSTNGTYLNEHRVSGIYRLKDGDVIRVGRSYVEVAMREAEPAPEEKPPRFTYTVEEDGKVVFHFDGMYQCVLEPSEISELAQKTGEAFIASWAVRFFAKKR